LKPAHLLFYCRAGFERECAQEMTAQAAAMGVEGFVKARPDSGFAVFQPHEAAMGDDLARHLEFARFVFPRQMVRTGDLLGVPEGDRAMPIAAEARRWGTSFAELRLEMPDTNEGKALSTLTKPLAPHLARALQKAGVKVDDAQSAERLHVYFVGGLACHVGVTTIGNSSPWPMGIPRLRMPGAAPSRSTLKLAEAFMEFMPGRQFEPGTPAIDLGAAPGGWTWQLVQRGFMVIAVDNGAMDARLMDSGQVKHRRDDGFHYKPTDPVTLMVCDMVESPSRIARLAAKWVAEGWCHETIFNLKLPMKKRFEELERCRALIDEALGGGGYYLRMKQLFHDREEVTAYLARR
jgi:23S rRNA (cytidine2498-2'-O)-methyltransferase